MVMEKMADDASYLCREYLNLGSVLEAELRWGHPPARNFSLGGWRERSCNGLFH
jgi:hypothetical protein